MKLVKITVVKIGWNQELVDQQAGPGLTPCTYQKLGQVFYTNGWQKPAGLCDNAWKSIQDSAMTLAHGGENFYDGWMKDKKSAMLACNDGFRPVVFYLETTDEDAPVFMDDPE